jgi:hypothetical protein
LSKHPDPGSEPLALASESLHNCIAFLRVRRLFASPNRALLFVVAVGLVFALRDLAEAQEASEASASHSNENESITTFKATTRMVTIDVVARDGKGNSLRDLKPDNFEVF